MLKVLSNILFDLDPKVKVIGQKAGICDGVPSTSALVLYVFVFCCFYTPPHFSVGGLCYTFRCLSVRAHHFRSIT